jgi:hypothetical protein
MTMYGSQTILESSQAPPPNNCLRSVHCHYRSLYLIYYNAISVVFNIKSDLPLLIIENDAKIDETTYFNFLR